MAEKCKSAPISVNVSQHDNFNVGPRYSDLRPLGYGGNGLVFSATECDSNKQVAIKKISFHDHRSCKMALREIRIMKNLRHDNIVSIREVLGTQGLTLDINGAPNYNELKSVYIVQELLDVDLHKLLQQHVLTSDHVHLFMYQLLRGVKYIHSANIIHRDLKPSNLLICTDELTLKINDFGLARIIDPKYSHKGYLTENIATRWYRAPELMLTPNNYTKAIDLWSVGCIFAELLTNGRPLFPGAHDLEQMSLIVDSVHLEENERNKLMTLLPSKALKQWSLVPEAPLKTRILGIDDAALDLLEKLLSFSPSKRISAEDALKHSYFSFYHCLADEPVSDNPFHIESEVDNLPSYTLKHLIFTETEALNQSIHKSRVLTPSQKCSSLSSSLSGKLCADDECSMYFENFDGSMMVEEIISESLISSDGNASGYEENNKWKMESRRSKSPSDQLSLLTITEDSSLDQSELENSCSQENSNKFSLIPLDLDNRQYAAKLTSNQISVDLMDLKSDGRVLRNANCIDPVLGHYDNKHVFQSRTVSSQNLYFPLDNTDYIKHNEDFSKGKLSKDPRLPQKRPHNKSDQQKALSEHISNAHLYQWQEIDSCPVDNFRSSVVSQEHWVTKLQSQSLSFEEAGKKPKLDINETKNN